jgi:fumarylacetoacetase
VALNFTHDPARRSWVAAANVPGSNFPIQNLPFAVFRRGSQEAFRGGVAIGTQIVDLAALAQSPILSGAALEAASAASDEHLNALMSLGAGVHSALRAALSRALEADSPARAALEPLLVPQAEAEYAVPTRVGDFTDFFTSVYHASAAGRINRPGTNPLMPNYTWVPIAYHSRSSSIRVSPHPVRRPLGQIVPRGETEPHLGACRRLDYEFELGAYVTLGNDLGSPVPMHEAEEQVFGLSLLNDWSARDIQAWEYQPLGPFLAKNFATTVAPWIVTLEALEPYRVAFERAAEYPQQSLPYLESAANRACGAFDIQLEALIQSEAMRTRGEAPQRVSLTSYRHAFWTLAQLVTHHTINGCNLAPGDLLGTGTLSGPSASEAGSLLELSSGGREEFKLGDSESRRFLEDGDTVIFRGWCQQADGPRIGLGEARGTIEPALPLPAMPER